MKLKYMIGLAAVTLGLATQANANLITQDVSLSTGAGSVQYLDFTVTDAGYFDISAQGEDSLNPNSVWNNDPQIYLFSDSLSAYNLVATDDDSGSGYEALIDNLYLSIGNYILAVSEYDFSLTEALGGTNNSIPDPGDVRITIDGGRNASATFGSTTTVPEPATLALLGLGLAGMGFMRRKQLKG